MIYFRLLVCQHLVFGVMLYKATNMYVKVGLCTLYDIAIIFLLIESEGKGRVLTRFAIRTGNMASFSNTFLLTLLGTSDLGVLRHPRIALFPYIVVLIAGAKRLFKEDRKRRSDSIAEQSVIPQVAGQCFFT